VKAQRCWNYISDHIIDRAGGEWFWSISDAGVPILSGDKAGFWKCPYHNSRMCLEIMMRLE
jgi:mannobiose 2-epimerase